MRVFIYVLNFTCLFFDTQCETKHLLIMIETICKNTVYTIMYGAAVFSTFLQN